jgi:hypothetical protein
MGAVHVAVFTRRELLPTFSNLHTSSIACGIGNVLTNKGAVAVKFNICDVSVCFTCAHLCCGTDKVLERNNDFQRVDAEIPQALLNLDRASLSHYIQTRQATYKQVLSTRRRNPRKARSMSIVEKPEYFRANQLTRSGNGALTDMVPLRNSVPLRRTSEKGGANHFNPVFSSNPVSEQFNPAFNSKAEDVQTSPAAESCRWQFLWRCVRQLGTTSSTHLRVACDRLAVCFDCSFFLGDLNYRISVDNTWLRYMLRVADQLEALGRLTRQSSLLPSSNSSGQLSPKGVEDRSIDMPAEFTERKSETAERDSRELKMAVLLSAISTRELRRLSENSDSESEDVVSEISDSNSEAEPEGNGEDVKVGAEVARRVLEDDDDDDRTPRPPSPTPPPPPPPFGLSFEDEFLDVHDEFLAPATSLGGNSKFDPIQALRNLNIYDANEAAPRDSVLVPSEQLCKLACECSAALKFVHRTGIKNIQAIYER